MTVRIYGNDIFNLTSAVSIFLQHGKIRPDQHSIYEKQWHILNFNIQLEFRYTVKSGWKYSENWIGSFVSSNFFFFFDVFFFISSSKYNTHYTYSQMHSISSKWFILVILLFVFRFYMALQAHFQVIIGEDIMNSDVGKDQYMTWIWNIT